MADDQNPAGLESLGEPRHIILDRREGGFDAAFA